MSVAAEEHDVFVSYRRTEPDTSWVHGLLVPGLRDSGLRVFLDVDDFVPGNPLVLEMTRAVESSRFTVAVFTPRYLTSGFTELENVMAQHLGLERAGRRLLGVLREACEPRLGVRSTLMVDMTDDASFSTRLAILVKAIRDPR